jgi:hypothetical protein
VEVDGGAGVVVTCTRRVDVATTTGEVAALALVGNRAGIEVGRGLGVGVKLDVEVGFALPVNAIMTMIRVGLATRSPITSIEMRTMPTRPQR